MISKARLIFRTILAVVFGYGIGIWHTGAVIGNPVEEGGCFFLGLVVVLTALTLLGVDFIILRKRKI